MEKEIEYARGTPDNWDAGLQRLKVQGEDITGPCPRCQHEFRQNLGAQIVVGFIGASEPILVELVCACGKHHEGAPSDARGCGAEGGVRVTGKGTVEPATLTAKQWAADLWANQVIKDRLSRARTAAEKWGATVSALTALFGTGVIINSDTVIRSLRVEWALAYGVLALGALSLAAGSILLAARAAQDKPIVIPADASVRLTQYDSLVAGAIKELGLSRVFALWAVVVLILSLLARWYAPVNSSAKSTGGVATAAALVAR